MSTRVDAVIRGGTIADGTGSDLFESDVAIHNGLIEAVASRSSRSHRANVVTSAGVVNGTIHLPLTWSISGMRA